MPQNLGYTLNMLLIASFVLIGSILPRATVSKDCKPPSTAFQVEPCGSVDQTLKIKLDTVHLSPYPPTPSQPITVSYTYNNTGNPVEKLLVDAAVEFYGEVAFKCAWHKLPVDVKDVDACSISKKCPIQQGITDETGIVDLSPWASLIDALAADTYYRLTIKGKDALQKELNCIKVSFLLAK